MKEVTGKLDFIKVINVCSAKDTVKRMTQRGREYLQKTYLIKDCYPKKYKELLKLTNNKMNNLI